MKISDVTAIALLCLLFVAAPTVAQDHPDAMILKRDAEWSREMAKKHRIAYTLVRDTNSEFFASTGGLLNASWWQRTIALYEETLAQLDRDVESTRQRFVGVNQLCMRRLQEFKDGLLGEARSNLNDYRREMPETDYIAPLMVGVFAGFPNVACATRHEKVSEALRELKAINPGTR